MSIVLEAVKILSALLGGWMLAHAFPDPPIGTDPEFWRATLRRRRKQLRKLRR